MKSFGKWLIVSVRVLCWVPRKKLLSTEQSSIPSCKNATAAFSIMENYGDDMVCHGRGREFLRQLCTDAQWDQPDDLGGRLASAIVANVEFGPTFALGLDMMRFFTWPGPVEDLHKEQIAGVFECMLGALEHGGRIRLVNAILRWSAAVVLLWAFEHQMHEFIPFMQTAHLVHWPGEAAQHQQLRDYLYHRIAMPRTAFVAILHGWMETSLHEAFADSPSHALVLPEDVPAQAQPHHVPGQRAQTEAKHSSVTGKHCVDLICYKCGFEDSTGWFRWSTECYAEAARKGWWKPNSKGWKHSYCRHCR